MASGICNSTVEIRQERIARSVLYLRVVIVSAARTWADVLVIPRGPGLASFHPTWRPELGTLDKTDVTEPQYELFHALNGPLHSENLSFLFGQLPPSHLNLRYSPTRGLSD